jgi:hypothetical protein
MKMSMGVAFTLAASFGASFGIISRLTHVGDSALTTNQAQAELIKALTSEVATLKGVDASAVSKINHLDASPLRLPWPAQRPSSKKGGSLWPMDSAGPARFVERVANAGPPYTDKVKAPKLNEGKLTGHGYELAYGMFLEPAAAAAATRKLPFKFLEIGLGCKMEYGPGASVKLWRSMLDFPSAQIWEADYDAACVAAVIKRGELDGVHTLTGDQADPAVLAEWVRTSGGGFDFVIDDGGHSNPMIANSFRALWPEVNPGGYYVMEDLMAGRLGSFGYPTDRHASMAVVVQDWIDQLIIKEDDSALAGAAKARHPLPPAVKFIMCIAKACIIAKCAEGEIFSMCPGSHWG